MSAALAPAVGRSAAGPRGSDGRLTFVRLVRSEWLKVTTVRTYWVLLLAAVVVTVGLGAVFASFGADGAATSDSGPGPAGPDFSDPVTSSLGAVNLAYLLVGVLGVLVAGGEYATGTIRSTLVAAPRRLQVLAAKVTVFTAVTLVTMTVATVAAFLVGQTFYGDDALSFSDDGVVRAVVGAAVYVTGVGVLGIGLGMVMRGTAAAIGTLLGALLILPVLTSLVTADWMDTLSQYLPSAAGQAFYAVTQVDGTLSPWTGLAVFAAYVVGLLAVATVQLKRRDA